jgi:hypothetical protein
MINLTDDRLDLELVGFLRDEAEDLHGTPDARGMTRRIAETEGSLGRRWARLFTQPAFRVAVVGMLLTATVGAVLVAGVARNQPFRNGSIVQMPWHFLDPSTGVYSDYPLCQAWCDDAGTGFAAWSRDGQQVAFVDFDGLSGTVQTGHPEWSIWRFDARTRQLSMVVECPPHRECAWPSFSVDGGSIAYVEMDATFLWDTEFFDNHQLPPFTAKSISHLVTIDLATGAHRRVDPAKGNFGMPGWTADGRVLVANQPGGDPNVVHEVLVDLDSGAMTEPVTRWPYAPARVSPDGTTIAYLTYPKPVTRDGILRPEENVYEVWLANVDGTGLRRIHTGTPAYVSVPPTWSPDGRQLAISVNTFATDLENYALDIESGAVRELPPDGQTMAWLPAD